MVSADAKIFVVASLVTFTFAVGYRAGRSLVGAVGLLRLLVTLGGLSCGGLVATMAFPRCFMLR